MSVKETLEFDASAAESAVDQLGSTLTSTADAFRAALTDALDVLTNVAVQEADADAVRQAIDTAEEEATADPVEIQADADALQAEIAGALAEADATVPVDADVSAAEARLDDFAALADASDFEATLDVDDSSVQAAAQSTRELADGIGEAENESSQLGFSLEQVKGIAATLGLAFGAREVVGFIREAVGAARDEVETLNKAREVFKQFAPEVIAFGETSAESVGLGDDAAIEFAATLGNLFTSMGLTRRASADMSIGMVELAADIGSFNNLGTDEVLNRLRAGIIGQVRPLRQLGISFNETEVSAKAVNLGLAEQGEELTEVEKIQARYAIILDKSKNSQGDFARTSGDLANMQKILTAEFENAQDTLGARLLPVTLDLVGLMRSEGIPTLQAFADPLFRIGAAAGQAGVATGGILLTGLQAVTPLLEVAADLLDTIPPDVLTMALNMVILSRAIGSAVATTNPLLALLLTLAPLLGALPGDIGSTATTMGLAAVAGSRLAGNFGAVAGATVVLGQTLGGAEGNALSLGATGALIGSKIAPGIGTAIGAVAGLALGFLSGGESAEEMRERVAALADEIEGLGRGAALARFLEDVDLMTFSAGEFGVNIDEIRTNIRALAEDSPAAAERVLAGFRELGAQGVLTAEQVAALDRAVERGTTSFQNRAVHTTEAQQKNEDYATSATKAAEAEEKAAAAVAAFAEAAVGQLPGASQALSDTSSSLTGFGLALNDSVSPEIFLAKLQETTAGIIGFQANLEATVAGGFTNVAAFVASQGPVVGGAYLQAFLAAPDAVRQATELALGAQQTATTEFDAFLRGPFAGVITAASQAGFAGMAPEADTAAANAALALAGGIPGIEGAALTAGQRATGGLKSGVAPIPGVAKTAVSGAVTETRGLSNPAYQGGALIGAQIGDGILGGLASRKGPIARAVRDIVNDALAAGRRAAESESPSKLFARELGVPIAEGVATGIAAGQPKVVAEAEAIVRAAAAQVLPAFSVAAGVGTGAASVTSGVGADGSLTVNFEVNVHGVSDPGTAEAVGKAVVRGAVTELDGSTRRRIQNGAVTG